jgi:hypothetical protein
VDRFQAIEAQKKIRAVRMTGRKMGARYSSAFILPNTNTAYQPEYLHLRGQIDQLRKSKMRVLCAFRELVGRYRTVLSPRRRNGKGKLIRLGSRFRHRNDSSVKIIWRACRHKVDS